MASDIEDKDPAPINSSYLVFFHAAILFIAPFIVSIFPSELRGDALLVALVFPITLFWFSYLIKQFIDHSVVMNIIVGAVFVVAALSFLNAVYGQLSEESVPVIYTDVPFFATLLAGLSGPIGLIYAGTILAYGAYVYISSVAIASLFESIYESFGKRYFLTKGMRKQLKTLDKIVDTSAARASDRFFVMNQAIGLAICVGLILVYAVLYILLLIA